jgi:hypothetical protein
MVPKAESDPLIERSTGWELGIAHDSTNERDQACLQSYCEEVSGLTV